MSFVNKKDRLTCWSFRDEYWKCLDEGKSDEECKEFRKQYEKFCPSQWVKHFDRKRDYLKFKEQIEKHGTCNSDGRMVHQNKSEEPITVPSRRRQVLAFRVTGQDSTH